MHLRKQLAQMVFGRTNPKFSTVLLRTALSFPAANSISGSLCWLCSNSGCRYRLHLWMPVKPLKLTGCSCTAASAAACKQFVTTSAPCDRLPRHPSMRPTKRCRHPQLLCMRRAPGMKMVAHRYGVVAETQSSSNILNPKSKAINHATPNFSSLTVKQANIATFNPQVYPPANH